MPALCVGDYLFWVFWTTRAGCHGQHLYVGIGPNAAWFQKFHFPDFLGIIPVSPTLVLRFLPSELLTKYNMPMAPWA